MPSPKKTDTQQRVREKTDPKVRLQKYLSDAGVTSRRHAEEMILAGRVLVNDTIVDALPAFVDPNADAVIVDGAPVKPQRLDYFIAHKPPGVVCSQRDPAGRPRAIDLLPPIKARLNVVGRLDVDSTGLLFLTNDGELAQRVTHPRYGLPKHYQVEIRGRAPDDLPQKMLTGVHLAEGKATAHDCAIKHVGPNASVLDITLTQGRNRQIRRMLAKLGYKVRKLKRVGIGPLSLKRLPPGAARRLSAKEITALRTAVAEAHKKLPPRARGRAKAKSGRPDPANPSAPATPSARPRSDRRGPATKPPGRRIIE